MVLTSWEMGAIAVIAVSGPKADQVLAALGGSPATLATGQVRRCDFSHAGTILDQGLLIRRGTAAWEMHLHGGLAVLGESFKGGGARVRLHLSDDRTWQRQQACRDAFL